MGRLIVGISGASGVVYGIRILEVLREQPGVETHLVVTKPAERTIFEETGYQAKDVKALADVVHSIADVGASIASGSFRTMGMIVAPCSIHTASAIAHCISDNLLSRAADVVLKERRKLVLVVRETPLHHGHLRMLTMASENGATIMPPMPAFYSRPKTIEEIIDHTVARVLDHFTLEHSLIRRWGEKETQRCESKGPSSEKE